jgi:hypothetical protein
MILEKGTFIIKFNEEDKEFVNTLNLEEKLKEIKEFFNIEGNFKIKICFIYSPEEYEFHTGRKFEDWIIASCYYNYTIFIFSPTIIEKFTVHKKEEIENTIYHEISHLFYGAAKFQNLPLFNEGIASYFKSGLCSYKIDFIIESLKGFKEYKHNYPVGHLMISSIIKHFGKESNKKIIEFLKSVGSEDDEDKLVTKFKKTFGIDVNTLIQLEGGIKK